MIKRDNFQSMIENKIEFVNQLAHDKEIAQCLLCTRGDFKNYEPTEEEMDKLAWTQIFPCKQMIDTQTTALSYITMSFSYEKGSSNIWKVGSINFYIFCHKSLIQTKYGVLRYDYILSRLNALLFDSRSSTWLGKLDVNYMDDLVYDESGQYLGVQIQYRSVEFM